MRILNQGQQWASNKLIQQATKSVAIFVFEKILEAIPALKNYGYPVISIKVFFNGCLERVLSIVTPIKPRLSPYLKRAKKRTIFRSLFVFL